MEFKSDDPHGHIPREVLIEGLASNYSPHSPPWDRTANRPGINHKESIMPTTICTTCQRTENWRNGKGSHRPVTCPLCHTDTLVPARYISRTADAPGHYEPAPARPRAHMVVCPICGRKRRSDSASLHIYDHPADVEADTYHVGQNDRWIPDIVCVPANTAHCWHHTVVGDFNCPVCGRRPRVVQDGYFCPSCARRLSALDITP